MGSDWLKVMAVSVCLNWLLVFIAGECDEGKAVPKCIRFASSFVRPTWSCSGLYRLQGFLAESVNRALCKELLAEPDLALLAGILLFILQTITYVVDVCRGEAKTNAILAMAPIGNRLS